MIEPESYRRLAALAHAGHRLASLTSVDEAYDEVVRMTLELVAGDSASIGRIDPARGIVRVVRNIGDLASWEEERPAAETYPLVDFPQLNLPAHRATAWYVALEDPGLSDPERRLLRALGKRSMLVVPLVVDQEIWGMVAVLRGHDAPPYSADDLAASEALAGMVASSLARLEERSTLEALAYRDALTGLGNRRAVDDRLEAVFSRERLTTPIAIVLCDVNGLKGVNDDHGHHAGDQVLREVGHLLSAEAGRHPGALAARLGGDEFCLILEGLDEAQLETITQRLTAAADELQLANGLSCGFAVVDGRPPGDAPTSKAAAKALLRLADAAQYRVKRSGPNVSSRSSAYVEPSDPERSVAADAVDLALARLAGAGPSVVDRLEAVATAIHDATDAGAWAVSRSIDRGPITIVRNLDRPRHDRADEPGFEPGLAYDLGDYPATAAALEGAAFHATLVSGDTSERAFLAASGYTELLAAGRTVGRDAWLVELCGDALSAPLVGLEPLLRLLIELAVVGAHAGRPDEAGPVVVSRAGSARGQNDGSSG